MDISLSYQLVLLLPEGGRASDEIIVEGADRIPSLGERLNVNIRTTYPKDYGYGFSDNFKADYTVEEVRTELHATTRSIDVRKSGRTTVVARMCYGACEPLTNRPHDARYPKKKKLSEAL